MSHSSIFSATLGLFYPWHIVSVSLEGDMGRLDIKLDCYQGNLYTCPTCGMAKAPCCFEEEIWFHADFFRHPTYLHARVPRIDCCQGVVATGRPWSRAGSRFGRLVAPQHATRTA